PGHRDIVDRDTGLLVPPDAAAPGLAAAIASLLGDPERRRRMGQAGRARVLKEFTLQSMIEKTAAVYRAAAAAGRGTRWSWGAGGAGARRASGHRGSSPP